MYSDGAFLVQYGWPLAIAFAILVFVSFIICGASSESHENDGAFHISLVILLVAIGALAITGIGAFNYEHYAGDHREEARKARGCQEVSVQDIDITYQGTPVIYDFVGSRVSVCDR